VAAPHIAIRRRILQAGAAGLLLPPALAAASHWRNRPRSLWVTRPQAQETVRSVYWADARLQRDGYAALNRIYRDVYAGQEHPIALGLLDLNLALQMAVAALWSPRPLILFSGYRTPATNLRVGGTRPNIHGIGAADDFIYEGISLLDNYRLARYFQVGGLGLYPERGSLHKDIGRLRSWVTRGR
jgi:uncharacterized protein YcbK (DUF882 family)